MVKVVVCLRQTQLLHTKRSNKRNSNRVVGVLGEIRTTNTIRNCGVTTSANALGGKIFNSVYFFEISRS
jgi:hypothetical protein